MSLLHKALQVAGRGKKAGSVPWLVRRFVASRDVPALRSLAVASSAPVSDPPVPTAEFAGVLSGRPGREVHAWLALDRADSAGGPVRGFVALVVADRRYSIGWLLVDPATRRCGVGTALVDHAVAEAALLGACEVHAATLSRWPTAVAFWDRMAERHA